ncbi:Tyw5p, partial [Perkinsus olseni]
MVFRGLAKSIKDDFSGDKLVKEFGDEKIALSLSIEERSDKPTSKSWTSMQEYVEGDVKGYIKQLPVPQNLAQKFQAILDATFCRHRKDTLYMWVGRASTVTATGVHSDDENNILVQLQGVKKVVLFPPDAGAAVYVNDKYDDGTRCCDADVYAQNWRGKWPKLAGVQMAALKVTLREGDVLYFPRNWYHDVRILPEDNIDRKSGGIDLSVSVNVFSTWWPRYMVEEARRSFLRSLHNAGWYKADNCYFQSDVVALCCWADVSTVRLLVDLLLEEGDEETSIGNLTLSRPLATTAEEGGGGDVGSFGRILPSQLPSVGVDVNTTDAKPSYWGIEDNREQGSGCSGVETPASIHLRSKVDGVIAADLTIRT